MFGQPFTMVFPSGFILRFAGPNLDFKNFQERQRGDHKGCNATPDFPKIEL